jgi:hypothetical protein
MMKSLITIFMTLTMLAGCANGGSMRFEVGPDFDDADFSESLTDVNYFIENVITDYDYGEIKFAPAAGLAVYGRKYDVQRVLVMDGGLVWVAHNMIDDQFKVIGWLAWSNMAELQARQGGAVDRFSVKRLDQGSWYHTQMYFGAHSLDEIQSFIVAEVQRAGSTVTEG